MTTRNPRAGDSYEGGPSAVWVLKLEMNEFSRPLGRPDFEATATKLDAIPASDFR